MSVGERITMLRKEKGISQGQLATLLEVSRQAVSKWENGQTSPDTLRLIRLAEVLDTDVEYLATGNRTVQEPAPIVVNVVEKVDRYVDRIVEKPVIRKVVRVKYRHDPATLLLCGTAGTILGFLLGLLF